MRFESIGRDLQARFPRRPVAERRALTRVLRRPGRFNADHDHQVSDELCFVQLTPPGSACSISIGTGVTDAEPGSVKGLRLVVDDADAAHADLSGRGVEVSPVQEFPWGRFVFFAEPDGNQRAVQQIVTPS